MKQYRSRGVDWCVRASSIFARLPAPLIRSALTADTKSVVLRSEDCEHGFSFRLARVAVGFDVVKDAFRGVDGARCRKGDAHVCVQYLERTPPNSPHNFALTLSEVYVHAQSVFYWDIEPSKRIRDETVVLTDHDIAHIHEQLAIFLHG